MKALRSFTLALMILLTSIGLSSIYLVGSGVSIYRYIVWGSILALLFLVCCLTAFDTLHRQCHGIIPVIGVTLIVVLLSSINALSTASGLPGYDQSYHVGDVKLLQAFAWPFPDSAHVSQGTAYVSAFPAIDIAALQLIYASGLDVFSVGRILPIFLSLVAFGLLLASLRRINRSSNFFIPFLLIAGGSYISFYFHTWFVSESLGFCMLMAIFFLIVTRDRVHKAAESLMFLVFIAVIIFSHEPSVLWTISFLALLVVFNRLSLKPSSGVIGVGRSGGAVSRFGQSSYLLWFMVAAVTFVSFLSYQILKNILDSSFGIVDLLLGRSTNIVNRSVQASPPLALFLWLGINCLIICFLVLAALRRSQNPEARATFFKWFVPGIAVSSLFLLFSVVSYRSTELAIDVTRVFAFIQVTLIVFSYALASGRRLAIGALFLAALFVVASLSHIPASTLNPNFQPSVANPDQKRTFQPSDYAGAEWLFFHTDRYIFCDEPMNQLVQGIWQMESSSERQLYLGGFDFEHNKGAYVFRAGDFQMVQLAGMPEGYFVKLDSGLFLSYQETILLARSYDNGNVISLLYVEPP